MAELMFRSHMTVEVMDVMGTDGSFAKAARVSTGRDLVENADITGLIGFLVKNRHGSPFEQAVMQWRIEAPIFVWREFHRHRIASYSEMSGRYTQLPPEFYIPGPERPLIQVGKPGAYTFEPGSDRLYETQVNHMEAAAEYAYAEYEAALNDGVAREVARMVLPVSIFSVCYVTMNVRALTSFLSLRTKSEQALFPSFPQREIEMVAESMEGDFAQYYPITHVAWNLNGRVPL